VFSRSKLFVTKNRSLAKFDNTQGKHNDEPSDHQCTGRFNFRAYICEIQWERHIQYFTSRSALLIARFHAISIEQWAFATGAVATLPS
jgi:NAD-dependent DNA ligase